MRRATGLLVACHPTITIMPLILCTRSDRPEASVRNIDDNANPRSARRNYPRNHERHWTTQPAMHELIVKHWNDFITDRRCRSAPATMWRSTTRRREKRPEQVNKLIYSREFNVLCRWHAQYKKIIAFLRCKDFFYYRLPLSETMLCWHWTRTRHNECWQQMAGAETCGTEKLSGAN